MPQPDRPSNELDDTTIPRDGEFPVTADTEEVEETSRRIAQRIFMGFRSGPFTNPLVEKLDKEHISKVLE